MSLLTIWTSNILIIFIVKFAVILALIFLLQIKKANKYWRFLWLLMAIYLILFQIVGTISNNQVAEQAPPLEQAPSVEVRKQTGINFALIWAYYPIMFAMLGFFLLDIGWKD